MAGGQDWQGRKLCKWNNLVKFCNCINFCCRAPEWIPGYGGWIGNDKDNTYTDEIIWLNLQFSKFLLQSTRMDTRLWWVGR